MSACPICGQNRRKDCFGGEMEDSSECPGWKFRGGDPRVSDAAVRKAAEAFVRSADHEVRLIDIRAALEAALD